MSNLSEAKQIVQLKEEIKELKAFKTSYKKDIEAIQLARKEEKSELKSHNEMLDVIVNMVTDNPTLSSNLEVLKDRIKIDRQKSSESVAKKDKRAIRLLTPFAKQVILKFNISLNGKGNSIVVSGVNIGVIANKLFDFITKK